MTNKTKRLTESAILIAVATVLTIISEFIPLKLPFGGSITLMSMLPIVIISYRYGVKWGLFSAFIFSLIQMLTGFKTVSAFFLPGESQMVLWQAILICVIDYILAYTVVGFAGAFRNKMKRPVFAICVGTIVALTLRYLMHFLSGLIFFGQWAEWFFTDYNPGGFGTFVLERMSGFTLSAFYSLVYNGLYMIPEIILTAIGAVILIKIPAMAKKIST